MLKPGVAAGNLPPLVSMQEQVAFERTQTSTGIVRVGMNERDALVVPASSEGQIYTAGLCGCTAVAATMRLTDGTHSLYMQHYAPRSSSQGIEALVRYLASVKEGGSLAAARVVIMHPGNPERPEVINDTATYWLLGAAEHALHNTSADIQRYPYDTERTFRIPGSGTLKATVNSSGESSVIADLEPLPRSR